MIFEINTTNSINKTIQKMKKNDTLILNDGIYNEKVYLTQDNIIIKAKNPHRAIIQNNDYYHKVMNNHKECNTFGTYTMYIGGNNVIIDGLHIINKSTPSRIYGQAVALHVDGNQFICRNCIIESAQDTLFTGPLPPDLQIRYKGFHSNDILKSTPSFQVYLNSKIMGDIDYIFGCATALFKNCEIVTINNEVNQKTYITAPAHNNDQKFGYLFLECKITNAKPTFLSRPWRDYGCAAFINNILDDNIIPEGFDKWGNSNRDKTARFYEYTPSNLAKRVDWSHQLSHEESIKYVADFLKYIDYETWVR